MEATISLLLPHPSSLKHNHHTYHLHPLPSSLTSSHIPCKLYAIRPRNVEFNGVRVDDDDGSKKRRKKSGRKWWRKQRQRPWWEFEDDEYDSLRGDYKKEGSFVQVVSSIWIFKVLRSYGWFFPFILLSLLLETGPKAFLIAFSIPLGLSLIILAFQKLRQWLNESLKPRRSPTTRSPFSLENMFLMEEDDGFEEEIKPRRRNRRRDYPSWEARNEDSTTRTNNFGGWDDLVSTEKETRHGTRNPKTSTSKVKVEEKMERPLEERDLPLLLRVLIALFPFLGSWTELL